MVTDPPALEAVLFGPDGAASAIPETATLIEMSTVGPTAIASAAERLLRPRARRPGARQRPVGRDRQARDPRRWRPSGLRSPRRTPLGPRDADLPRTLGLGSVAEARQQRGVDRGAGGPRRAAGAHRPRGSGDRRRPSGPGGRSARLADRTVAAASQGRGPGVLLPPRARAQGPRARVRRGRTRGRRPHVSPRRPRLGATRRSRPGSATRTSARSSRSCGGSDRPEALRLPSSA